MAGSMFTDVTDFFRVMGCKIPHAEDSTLPDDELIVFCPHNWWLLKETPLGRRQLGLDVLSADRSLDHTLGTIKNLAFASSPKPAHPAQSLFNQLDESQMGTYRVRLKAKRHQNVVPHVELQVHSAPAAAVVTISLIMAPQNGSFLVREAFRIDDVNYWCAIVCQDRVLQLKAFDARQCQSELYVPTAIKL